MLKALLAILLFLGIAQYVNADSSRPLVFRPGQPLELISPPLDDITWRWLGLKREIVVAQYGDSAPPMMQLSVNGTITGIVPEVLQLVTQSLGLHLRFIRFDSREQALVALHSDRVDAVLDIPDEKIEDSRLAYSSPLMVSRLVVAKSEQRAFHEPRQQLTLAVLKDLASAPQLHHQYPHASFITYPDLESALTSVAVGETHGAVGDLIPMNYLIERNFTNSLMLDSILPLTGAGYHLLIRKQDSQLIKAVNTTLDSLPPSRRELLLRRWDQGAVTQFINTPLDLNEGEKAWLAAHSSVGILVTQFSAPYMLYDELGHFNGITADVLNLIHLKTGLRFIPHLEDNIDKIPALLDEPEYDMVGAIT